MRRNMTLNLTSITLTLVTVAVLVATAPLHAQAPAKKKAGPTVQELQQQIIELQGRLMECQNTAKANAPSPMKDALEAFQTFNSTIDTGVNQSAYKAALVPLKVKVDKLPDDDQTASMKRTLVPFVDAGNLWNISIARAENGRGLFVPTAYVQEFISKYPEEWKKIRGPITHTFKQWSNDACGFVGASPGGVEDVAASCVKSLGMALMEKGQENIKGFPKP